MNATPSRSFHPDNSYPRAECGTGALSKSQAKVLHQSSGSGGGARALAGGVAHARAMALAAEGVLPLAAHDFRDWFLPNLARWLQLNFDNPEHVARAFGVRNATADNWWNARNCLSGDMSAIVFMTFPAARDWFMAEWAAR